MSNASIEIFASSVALHSYIAITAPNGTVTTYDYGPYDNGAGEVIVNKFHPSDQYVGSGAIDLTADEYSNLMNHVNNSIASPPTYDWTMGMQCTTWSLDALLSALGCPSLLQSAVINPAVLGTFLWNPITLAPSFAAVQAIKDLFGSAAKTLGPWASALASLFGRVMTDPVVLDLSGNGVELTSLSSSSAYFDLHGTGYAVKTGWVGASTGILVNSATPTSINDLFGNSSVDGFTALKALDTNSDGVINASDAGFSSLYVWVDANGDGTAGAGEVYTLSQLNITQINLSTSVVNTTVNGNLIGEVANDNEGRLNRNFRRCA